MRLRKLKTTIVSKIILLLSFALFHSITFAKNVDIISKEINGELIYFIESKVEYSGANTENKAALKAKGQLVRYLGKKDKSISSLNFKHFNLLSVAKNNQFYIYKFTIKQSDINKQE